MTSDDKPVSRRRYERVLRAREEAESLLEDKSRELYLANLEVKQHAASLEERIRERTKELQEALERVQMEAQARSRFIATMSHEIRTPLGGLLGMIDLLSFQESDPEKVELLNIANESGLALRRIVNDVLDFSKIESGVLRFDREQVDIRALTNGIVKLAATNQKGIDREIHVEISNEVPERFWGDATRIRQVISNFVNNALSYSKHGAIFIRATQTECKNLRIEVQDFGVGVAPEKLDQLFQDFSQISNTLTASAQGTGLGLAISKRIVEGMGGEIGVDSEPQRGSTFWFEMAMEVVETLEMEASEDLKENLTDTDLTACRVLLVEDNIINQKMLTKNLDRMGVQTTLAENGLVATQKFKPGMFDLILMDIAMPVMDGLEATQKIRANWPEKDIPPIFALTAHIVDEVEEDAARAGIDKVLTKPIPYDELRNEISKVLSDHSTKVEDNSESLHNSGLTLLEVIGERMKPDAIEQLLQLFSEPETVDILNKFRIDLSVRLQKIIEAVQLKDTQTICNEAHSLKGASSVMGFMKLADRLSDVEECARESQFEKMTTEIAIITEELNWLTSVLNG